VGYVTRVGNAEHYLCRILKRWGVSDQTVCIVTRSGINSNNRNREITRRNITKVALRKTSSETISRTGPTSSVLENRVKEFQFQTALKLTGQRNEYTATEMLSDCFTRSCDEYFKL
jgi:hypothetical protein